MLRFIVIALLALWLLGLATSFVFGGLIHLLLIAAIILLLFRMLRGRRTA